MNRQNKIVNSENGDIIHWAIEFDQKYIGEINRLREEYPSFYNKMRDFLTLSPDVPIGGHRVFPLMGDEYRGAWEYKVCVRKRTCRIFYVLDTTRHTVLTYYAGPKPNNIPLPPTISSSEPDVETSSSHNNRRSADKKRKTQRC